jgi:hypothetical protein
MSLVFNIFANDIRSYLPSFLANNVAVIPQYMCQNPRHKIGIPYNYFLRRYPMLSFIIVMTLKLARVRLIGFRPSCFDPPSRAEGYVAAIYIKEK